MLTAAVIEGASSPRPWGCFLLRKRPAKNAKVFPTPVGVFLDRSTGLELYIGLPHARGGVSVIAALADFLDPSSPRPWGCF